MITVPILEINKDVSCYLICDLLLEGAGTQSQRYPPMRPIPVPHL